jgi:hypothetical protein
MLVVRVWHGASKQLAGAAADTNIHYKIPLKAQLVSKQPAGAGRQGYQHQQQQQTVAVIKTAAPKQMAQQEKQLRPAGTT